MAGAPPSPCSATSITIHTRYAHSFLQFGAPHGLSGQAQHVAAARGEVWVNVCYRLSVFGFLACDTPHVDGNFGFKDVWTALLWIRTNIAAFGGDPENVQVTGLSAGKRALTGRTAVNQ